jgi:hypothetical protein
MMGHEQVSVKVNAKVDREIAPVVSLLSEIDGLETVASCEGVSGSAPAYVYFNYGDWHKLGALLFERLGPTLWASLQDEATVSLEIFNDSEPMGKLTFDKEATGRVASLLEQLLQARPCRGES